MVATGAAALGWLAIGEDPRRPRHLAGRRVRRRRRAGRDHPGLLVGHAARRDPPRRRSPACVCALAVGLKYKLGYDDSLDVVGVHLVGGLMGHAVASASSPRRPPPPASTACSTAAARPALAAGVGALAVLVYSFVVTFVIGIVIQKTMGFRITEEDEVAGIDSVEHAETAYDFASLGGSAVRGTSLVGQAHAEARNTEGVRA